MNTVENMEHDKKIVWQLKGWIYALYACVIILIGILFVGIYLCSLSSTVLLGMFITGLLGLMIKHRKTLSIKEIKEYRE